MGRTHISSPERNAALLPGFQFLCRFFWGPDSQHCREMAQDGFSEVSSTLQSILPPSARTAMDAFNTFLEARPDPGLLCQDLEIAYARLFLSGRAAAGAPLYQSCYLFDDAPLMGPPALRMQERLGQAGLSIAGQGNEPPDHLAVELEYLCFLLSKTRENGGAESMTSAVSFAENELCSWLPQFADRLSRIPDSEPYNFAAILARDMARLIAGGQ